MADIFDKAALLLLQRGSEEEIHVSKGGVHRRADFLVHDTEELFLGAGSVEAEEGPGEEAEEEGGKDDDSEEERGLEGGDGEGILPEAGLEAVGQGGFGEVGGDGEVQLAIVSGDETKGDFRAGGRPVGEEGVERWLGN